MSKKVYIKDLRAVNNKKDNVKVITFNDIDIEVKQHISIQEKKIIVELMTTSVFDKETGLYDSMMKEIMMCYFLSKFYTNINITDDMFGMYNLLSETGLLDQITSAIPESEIDFITQHLNIRINSYKEVLSKSDHWIYKVLDFLSNIDDNIPEVLNTVKDFDQQN